MDLPIQDTGSRLAALLPSSLVSLAVHLGVLIVAGMSLRGCDRGVPVEAGGRDYREVGLAVIPDHSGRKQLALENPSAVLPGFREAFRRRFVRREIRGRGRPVRQHPGRAKRSS
jgi:hypothetical protein